MPAHLSSLSMLAALALAACTEKPQPVQVTPPAQALPIASTAPSPFKPGSEGIEALAAEDLVGYLSGNYHTMSNNPAIYADRARHVLVMMGKRGRAELPLDKPQEVSAAFEKFLLLHGYPANGKTPGDDHQKVIVEGKEMVVMSMDEIFPKMPDDLKAHFTQRQNDVLYRTATSAGYQQLAQTVPVMWAGSKSVFVQGPGVDREFPIEKADDAFAEYRKLLAK